MTRLSESQNPVSEVAHVFGYARVSTEDQNLALQLDALRSYGCSRVYEDVGSGSLRTRPGLEECLRDLRAEDTLVVWRLDRLGRSLQHLLEIVSDLQERRVGFVSLREQIDTTSPAGRLVFSVFGALAEYERAMIRERAMAGAAAAKARGVKMGRRPALNPSRLTLARKLVEDGEKPAEVARLLKVGRATIYRALRDSGAA